MLARITREPVLVTTLISAVITLLLQLGVPNANAWTDAINAVVVATLALYARSKVTPVSTMGTDG